MTATSSGRRAASPAGAEREKARDARGPFGMVRGRTAASDRERRSAAAAAGRVRILERETGFLEIALVVERDAVQVLGAEGVDEDADAGRLEHHIVLEGLVFDAQAVLEPRAAARQHADAEAGGLGGDFLLDDELPDFLGRARREGQ